MVARISCSRYYLSFTPGPLPSNCRLQVVTILSTYNTTMWGSIQLTGLSRRLIFRCPPKFKAIVFPQKLRVKALMWQPRRSIVPVTIPCRSTESGCCLDGGEWLQLPIPMTPGPAVMVAIELVSPSEDLNTDEGGRAKRKPAESVLPKTKKSRV